jgi:membrane protein DedA with SNARE-associated domain
MDVTVAGVIGVAATHAALAPVFAALLAVGETFVVLSFFIPATAILLGLGAMVATGAIPFLPVWAGATVGAMIGSTLTWWIGRRWGPRVLSIRPLRRRPDLIERTRAVFARHGGAAVFIGHVIGAIRPLVFLFAGMSAMGFWRFQMWNTAGALASAFASPKAGEVGGHAIGWLRPFLGL